MLAVGDLGNVGGALHMARMSKRLTGKVTIYTHGASELSEELIKAKGGDEAIQVNTRRIAHLRKSNVTDSEVIVDFEDSTTVTEGFIVRLPSPRRHSSLRWPVYILIDLPAPRYTNPRRRSVARSPSSSVWS